MPCWVEGSRGSGGDLGILGWALFGDPRAGTNDNIGQVAKIEATCWDPYDRHYSIWAFAYWDSPICGNYHVLGIHWDHNVQKLSFKAWLHNVNVTNLWLRFLGVHMLRVLLEQKPKGLGFRI